MMLMIVVCYTTSLTRHVLFFLPPPSLSHSLICPLKSKLLSTNKKEWLPIPMNIKDSHLLKSTKSNREYHASSDTPSHNTKDKKNSIIILPKRP